MTGSTCLRIAAAPPVESQARMEPHSSRGDGVSETETRDHAP